MKKHNTYFYPTYQGYTCIIPSLIFDKISPSIKKYPTIETYYTYSHINMLICAFDSNIGLILYITKGKATLVYYDIKRGEKVYQVRIRRLSIFNNMIYIQVEYLTTLWIIWIYGNDRIFQEYTIVEVLLQVDHFIKKDQRYYFSSALFQIL